MNWIRELLNVYELKSDIVGIEQKGRFGERLVLLPQYHSTQVATVTVVLSGSGDFLRATRVAKDDAVTVIPVVINLNILLQTIISTLLNSIRTHQKNIGNILRELRTGPSLNILTKKFARYMNTSKKDVSSAILSKAGFSCRTNPEKSRA